VAETGEVSTHIHRVIVRGRFDGLDERQVAALRRAQHRHDVLDSAFTEAGVLTYGPEIGPFSLRYEIRTTGDDDGRDVTAEARQVALHKATAELDALGVGYRDLRVAADEMTALWRSG